MKKDKNISFDPLIGYFEHKASNIIDYFVKNQQKIKFMRRMRALNYHLVPF